MFYGDWLYRRELLSPNNTALIDADSGNQEITYRQWNRRVNQMANFLQARLDVGKGDRISIYSMNRMGYLDILFACNKLGAVLQVINWRLTVGELESIISEIDPTVVLYSEEWIEQINQMRGSLQGVKRFLSLDVASAEGDLSWVEESTQLG